MARVKGRTCSKCGTWKGLDGFYLYPGKDVPQAVCKDCRRHEDVERYHRGKETGHLDLLTKQMMRKPWNKIRLNN
jgi:hypothetical protein